MDDERDKRALCILTTLTLGSSTELRNYIASTNIALLESANGVH